LSPGFWGSRLFFPEEQGFASFLCGCELYGSIGAAPDIGRPH